MLLESWELGYATARGDGEVVFKAVSRNYHQGDVDAQYREVIDRFAFTTPTGDSHVH